MWCETNVKLSQPNLLRCLSFLIWCCRVSSQIKAPTKCDPGQMVHNHYIKRNSELVQKYVFSCPEQLNRWPCHWLTHSVSHSTFTFDTQIATLETCDLWDIWSDWWGVTFETFDQSDEETWPDKIILPTHLPTCPPSLEYTLKMRF